jgi:hypothetical protein
MTEINVTVCFLQESMKQTHSGGCVHLAICMFHLRNNLTDFDMWFIQGVYTESSQENFVFIHTSPLTYNLHEAKIKYPKNSSLLKELVHTIKYNSD